MSGILSTPPQSSGSDKIFLSSPFSDYGTDTSPSTSSIYSGASLSQLQLIRRINNLASQIAHADPSPQSAKNINAKIDLVEGELAAPETQTTTNVEDSGLFMDDDEDGQGLGILTKLELINDKEREKERTVSQDATLLRKSHEKTNQKASSVSARIRKITLELQKRLGEVKSNNAAMEAKIANLTALLREAEQENDDLTEVAQKLIGENKALEEDYRLVGSELAFLKYHVGAMEDIAGLQGDEAFNKALTRFNKDWLHATKNYNGRPAAQLAVPMSADFGRGQKGPCCKASEQEQEQQQSEEVKEKESLKPSPSPSPSPSAPAPESRWSAFWGALGDACYDVLGATVSYTGIQDYHKLMYGEESST